jgi:hypothetical protein
MLRRKAACEWVEPYLSKGSLAIKRKRPKQKEERIKRHHQRMRWNRPLLREGGRSTHFTKGWKQRYTEITHDPLLLSVAQGIF